MSLSFQLTKPQDQTKLQECKNTEALKQTDSFVQHRRSKTKRGGKQVSTESCAWTRP